jgi:hypothetical protein
MPFKVVIDDAPSDDPTRNSIHMLARPGHLLVVICCDKEVLARIVDGWSQEVAAVGLVGEVVANTLCRGRDRRARLRSRFDSDPLRDRFKNPVPLNL